MQPDCVCAVLHLFVRVMQLPAVLARYPREELRHRTVVDRECSRDAGRPFPWLTEERQSVPPVLFIAQDFEFIAGRDQARLVARVPAQRDPALTDADARRVA